MLDAVVDGLFKFIGVFFVCVYLFSVSSFLAHSAVSGLSVGLFNFELVCLPLPDAESCALIAPYDEI